MIMWINSFSTKRLQVNKVDSSFSTSLPINKSIVHGSGVRLTLYFIMESDRKAMSLINQFHKYADDTNLLSPENAYVNMCEESKHIKKWAIDNIMTIDVNKLMK